MKSKSFLSLLLVLLLSTTSVWAQALKVTGVVIDGTFNEPLLGATILEKGTTNGTTTDMDGNFSLSVNPGAELVISFVGYIAVTQPASASMNITLQEDKQTLEETVVVGYQTARKADLTGSVSVVKLKEVSDVPSSNPMESLQGRVPGVNISTDGSPEGAVTVKIRGIGTLGNNDPLYVIDGMPTKRGLNELNSRDIESIQVLKDASSASIYGSRAANGVIIITTKRAKEGYKEISFNASLSTQFYNNRMKVLDAQGLGRAVWQAWVNDGSDPNSAQSLYAYQRGKTFSPNLPFELAGADGVWHPARVLNFLTGKSMCEGTVTNNVLDLSAPGVAAPTAVRYAWNLPWTGSVYNEVNLPLGTFERKVER